MSVAKQTRCVFCTFARSVRTQSKSTPVRTFHSSIPRQKRKPRFQSIKADNLINIKTSAHDFSKANGGALSERYTPEQLASIQSASKVFNAEQNTRETANRADPWFLNYYDDLTAINPVVDKPVKAPWSNLDENSRLKKVDEFDADFLKLMQNLPENPKEYNKAWEEFDRNMRLTVGKEETERSPRTALAPDIPRLGKMQIPGREVEENEEATDESDESAALKRLSQMTGLKEDLIRSLRVKTIVTHRVANQTRLGKIHKQYFLSVAGNGNGLVGIGEASGEEPNEARLQSQYKAIRNMRSIMRYENRTIFGDVKGKVSATELELYHRPPGFGLRCQQYIYEICRCAGISDLAAKVTRSRNPMNTVKATIGALMSQKDPEDIARARGKKLVDVRKVYYAGLV